MHIYIVFILSDAAIPSPSLGPESLINGSWVKFRTCPAIATAITMDAIVWAVAADCFIVVFVS